MTDIKLWIDDVRPAPDESWVWAKTEQEAYNIWSEGNVVEISFDHDLGQGSDTRRIATSILGMAYHGQRMPPRWYVHSANPAGREYLVGTLEKADHYWRHNATQKNLQASYAIVSALSEEA